MKVVVACRGVDAQGKGRASGDKMLTKLKMTLIVRLKTPVLASRRRARLGGVLARAAKALSQEKSA